MTDTETTPLINRGGPSAAGQPSNVARDPTDGPSQGLKDFLNQLGIGMQHSSTASYSPRHRKTDTLDYEDINTGKPLKNGESIYQMLRSAYNWHRAKYITAYGVAYTLLILQLAIGITISILTALKPPHANAIVIILGGVNSLIAGLAGIMQYMGEPMRSWRVFIMLDNLKRELAETWGNFRVPSYNGNGLNEGHRLEGIFDQTMADALANEPQVWASGSKTMGEVMTLEGSPNRNRDRDDREDDRPNGREDRGGGRREGV